MVAAVAAVGAPPIVPAVIESKRRGVGWHCVHSPSEEGGDVGGGAEEGRGMGMLLTLHLV